MPFGIRPSNVRVCHFTTRARAQNLESGTRESKKRSLSRNSPFLIVLVLEFSFPCAHRRSSQQGAKAAFMMAQMKEHDCEREADWIKVDLHIHTLDDPKDHLDYSAHQLLERARDLGFGALAITLHDKVFDRPEVFADAAAMGILLIPAAEMRLEGADVVLLNVRPDEVENLRTFDDLRQLRARSRRVAFLFCAASIFLSWRFDRATAASGNRLLRRDRDLPLPQGLVRPQSPRPPSRYGARQTASRDFRRASPPGFRRALHQHPAAAPADDRGRPAYLARRSTSPNESGIQLARSVERLLLRPHQASASQAPRNRPTASLPT